MAALGDVSLTVESGEVWDSSGQVTPTWPDVSVAVPADIGSASTNPETFAAFVAG